MDAGDFKHELLNRLRSTMAVNVLIFQDVGMLNDFKHGHLIFNVYFPKHENKRKLFLQ